MSRKVFRSAVLLVCLLSPFIAWRFWLLRDVHRQLAAIRAAGLPTNARELDRWYAAVPEKQNAALVLAEAMALCNLRNGGKVVGDFRPSGGGQKMSAEQAEGLRHQIGTDSKSLAKVDEALKLPASRYPTDLSMGLNTPLPHLAYLKRFADLNRCQAALALEANEFASASTNVGKILGLARTLEKEPVLISQLVRLKLISMAVGTLESRIGAGPVNGVEITNLMAAFQRMPESSEQLAIALIGERAMLASYFHLKATDARRMLGPAKDEETERSFPRRRSLALSVAGFYDLDLGFFLHAMGRSIELAVLPAPESLKIAGYLDRAGEKARERSFFISASLASYGAAIPRQMEADAQVRLAVSALAIEAFRNQESRLPQKLEEVAPNFLADVLADPFDGAPLRYRRRENGFVLYSIGRDREDNGGREKPEGKTYSGRSGFDITFTVAR